MKYNPRRNYLHPVLRPYSDDYPNGNLRTEVKRSEIAHDALNLSLIFDVTEPSIQEQVQNGSAICVAMLYCGATLHREMLQGGIGSLEILASIPTTLVRDNVELHPAIITRDDISHSTETAHGEYGAASVSINRWQPLATDQTWRFQVNPNVRPTKGIFNLEPDDTLPDGMFDIKTDMADRYVNITANRTTMGLFKKSSGERALSTIYTSALVSALAEIKDVDGDAEIHDDGWVNCIKNNLKRLNASIGDQDQDQSTRYSLLRAAQLLLGNPFDSFLALSNQEDADNDEEDQF